MRCATFFVCAPLALCAQSSSSSETAAPRSDVEAVNFETLMKMHSGDFLFTPEFLEDVYDSLDSTPGDYTKFTSLFSTNATEGLKEAFSIAVRDSMIDSSVFGLSAAWRRQLINNPAGCILTYLNTCHMFKFLQFLAFECNKAFVDTLLPILNPIILERIHILAAVYEVPEFMECRFPHFEDSPLYSMIKSGNISKLIEHGSFEILIKFLKHAANTGNRPDLLKWYDSVSFDEQIAFFAECHSKNYELFQPAYAGFPVSAAVFEALVLKANLKMTILLRNILACVKDSEIEVLKNNATNFYSERKYEQYFQITFWLPTVDKLHIPRKDTKQQYAFALTNAKATFLHPLKAKIVCDAFVALNEPKMLELFLWRYIQDNVYDKEMNHALALVWQFQRESLFTRVVFFANESLAANAAKHVAAAHRAAVSVTKERLAVFAESLVALPGFSVADFEESLKQLLVNCSLADIDNKSKRRPKQTQKMTFDAYYVLQLVKDKHSQYMERYNALSKSAVIVCVTEPSSSKSNQ